MKRTTWILFDEKIAYASVDADFECAHARHDLVVRVLFVFVWYQLAVDVAHCVFLWDKIKDDITFVGAECLNDSGFHC